MRILLRSFIVVLGLSAWLCGSVITFRSPVAWAMNIPASSAVDEESGTTSLSTTVPGDHPDMVLIVSVPGLSFQEWTPLVLKQMPHMKRLAEQGWVAALNIRTPERGIEDVYMSINAGAPAIVPSGIQAYRVADEEGAMAHGRSSDIRERYERFTGLRAFTGEIVVPELGYLVKVNESQTYGASIGKLGDALYEHGVRVAVYGHRYDGEGVRSDAPLMLLSSTGKVPGGNISDDWLVQDPDSPYGYRTDAGSLLAAASALSAKEGADPASPAVILIEYGDWYSLDQERRNYTSEHGDQVRWRELRKLDELIGQLTDLIETQGHAQLWIMSPQPHAAAARAKLHVTPFVLYEHRADQQAGGPGLLTSPTTKRPGLISLHDLGPTLLAAVGIPVEGDWLGFAAERTDRPDALTWLLEDVTRMQHVYELRTNIVAIFVGYEVLVLLFGLLMVLMRWHRQLKWMRLPIVSVLTAPLGILLLGLIPGYKPLIQAAVLVVVVLLLSLCCVMLPDRVSIFLIAVANVIVLLTDGLAGSRLLKYSIMGYDPMIGARYYGIGNEYMGVLVGSAILAMTMIVQEARIVGMGEADKKLSGSHEPGVAEMSARMLPPRQSRHTRGAGLERIHPGLLAAVCGAMLLGITLYMAAPNGGTNAGGALTACAAFGVAWLGIYGRERLRRLRTIHLLWIVAGLLLVGLLLLWAMNQWLNISGAEGKSHIGRAMDLLTAGRIDLIIGIIVRKLQMNLNLIRVSAWGKVLLTGIFVLSVLLFKPKGVFSAWQETRPVWMGGFTAIIIGAIVALALNDSGIVAAGTMIVYAAAPILLLVSEEEQAHLSRRE